MCICETLWNHIKANKSGGQAAPAPAPAALTPELVQQLHSNGVSAGAPLGWGLLPWIAIVTCVIIEDPAFLHPKQHVFCSIYIPSGSLWFQEKRCPGSLNHLSGAWATDPIRSLGGQQSDPAPTGADVASGAWLSMGKPGRKPNCREPPNHPSWRLKEVMSRWFRFFKSGTGLSLTI